MQPELSLKPAQVFISYANQDRDRVISIADGLAAAGVSIWLDRDKIEGATRWAEEIVSGIENSRVMILIMLGCIDEILGGEARDPACWRVPKGPIAIDSKRRHDFRLR